MSYEEDRSSALLWEKVRVGSIVVAVIFLCVGLVTKLPWIDWFRAAAWMFAGYAGFREARALKRLGRDPDASYLRAALCAIVGVLCLL